MTIDSIAWDNKTHIEIKPLYFSREDIQNILLDKHEVFKRLNSYLWELNSTEQLPSENTTVNIPLCFYKIGDLTQSYNTECLVSGPDLTLKYFRTPTCKQSVVTKAVKYIEDNIESPHKDVLLEILSRG